MHLKDLATHIALTNEKVPYISANNFANYNVYTCIFKCNVKTSKGNRKCKLHYCI